MNSRTVGSTASKANTEEKDLGCNVLMLIYLFFFSYNYWNLKTKKKTKTSWSHSTWK